MTPNISDYYSQIEKGSIDKLSLYSYLRQLMSSPDPMDIFHLLIETDVLNNVIYREDEFLFWTEFKRYNFVKLNFNNAAELNNAAISYIESRIATTSNKLFKAKYNHALWYSSIKKIEHAQNCIDNYFGYISERLLNYDINDTKTELCITEYLEHLNKLCNRLNYRTNDFHSLIKEIINKKDSLPDWFIYNVIEIAFPHRKVLGADFNKICFQTLEDILNSADLDYSFNENAYSLGIKYGQYLNIPLLNLHNYMGQYCLQFALKRDKGKSDFLIPKYYGKAIDYFKLAGNTEMEDKLNADFTKIKTANQLPTGTFEISLNEELSAMFIDNDEVKKNQINSLNTVGMIDFICNDESLIPSNRNTGSQNHLSDIFTKLNLDINNNFNNDQKKPIINPFKFHLELFTIKYLHYYFKNCIESDKVNSEILIAHLENNSWFGNTTEGRYWLDLLRPGITSFFSVYRKYLSEPTLNNLEFVLPLDSLAIKMEGILRTFAQLNGINTTKIEKEKGSSDIESSEIFMHDLLSESYPQFKALFSDNEYKFFKGIYLKGGYDIRNNIAHSFYKPKDYTINKLLLVMLSIMRISKNKNISNN